MREIILGVALLIGLGSAFSADARDAEWDDVYYLAEALYFESRSESDACQLEVSKVILTRTLQNRFKAPTIEQVVHAWSFDKYGDKVCQFSYYCDGKSDRMTNEYQKARAIRNASLFLAVVDFDIDGNDHYYAHKRVYPTWAPYMTDTFVCDDHTIGKLKW
ncbi:endolysin [Vibrio phage D148]